MTKKIESDKKKYLKSLSMGIVNNQDKAAGASIGLLYEKVLFSNNEIEIEGLDSTAIANAIKVQEKLLAKGDLTSLENMLFGQVHTLNAIFTMMVARMSNAERLDQLEAFGRLALKAQNQTRQTVSSLAEIKGIKKTTFINQLNNAHNQQINNGAEKNLNNSANERVRGDVDARSETVGKTEDFTDEALALSEDAGGQEAFSYECTQTRPAIPAHERAGETVVYAKSAGKGS